MNFTTTRGDKGDMCKLKGYLNKDLKKGEMGLEFGQEFLSNELKMNRHSVILMQAATFSFFPQPPYFTSADQIGSDECFKYFRTNRL